MVTNHLLTGMILQAVIWVFPKIGKHPKMHDENHGKPYEQMDDLVVPLFLETPI